MIGDDSDDGDEYADDVTVDGVVAVIVLAALVVAGSVVFPMVPCLAWAQKRCIARLVVVLVVVVGGAAAAAASSGGGCVASGRGTLCGGATLPCLPGLAVTSHTRDVTRHHGTATAPHTTGATFLNDNFFTGGRGAVSEGGSSLVCAGRTPVPPVSTCPHEPWGVRRDLR